MGRLKAVALKNATACLLRVYK